MPRSCTVCTHERHEQIDDLLAAGLPKRQIASSFGVTEQSLKRHQDRHLPGILAATKRAVHADSLMARLEYLTREAHRLRGSAEREGDYRTALAAVRELVRIVELQSKLIGELKDSPAVNVLVAPQWLAVRTAIIEVLRPYPEVRALVAGRLAELENVA